MKDYTKMVMAEGTGRTARLCQKALCETLEELFAGKKFRGQTGPKPLKVFEQDLPIPTEDDPDADTDAAAAPYVLVQVNGGSIPNDDSPQTIEFSIVICTYDLGREREGWEEVSNIKEDIIQRFCQMPYFGGAFTVLKPIAWAIQKETSPPYYFGALTFNCTAPAMTQDMALSDLL